MKKRKISFKYKLYKEKRPRLNDKGIPLFSLYMRIIFNQKSTSFLLSPPIGQIHFENELTEEEFQNDFEDFKMRNGLDQLEGIFREVIYYEYERFNKTYKNNRSLNLKWNKRFPKSQMRLAKEYNVAGIGDMISHYLEILTRGIDRGIRNVIFKAVEDELSYKKYMNARNRYADLEEQLMHSIGRVELGSIHQYCYLEKEYKLDLKNFLKQEQEDTISALIKFQLFLYFFHSEFNQWHENKGVLFDWEAGKLQKPLNDFLEKKVYNKIPLQELSPEQNIQSILRYYLKLPLEKSKLLAIIEHIINIQFYGLFVDDEHY